MTESNHTPIFNGLSCLIVSRSSQVNSSIDYLFGYAKLYKMNNPRWPPLLTNVMSCSYILSAEIHIPSLHQIRRFIGHESTIKIPNRLTSEKIDEFKWLT